MEKLKDMIRCRRMLWLPCGGQLSSQGSRPGTGAGGDGAGPKPGVGRIPLLCLCFSRWFICCKFVFCGRFLSAHPFSSSPLFCPFFCLPSNPVLVVICLFGSRPLRILFFLQPLSGSRRPFGFSFIISWQLSPHCIALFSDVLN